MLNPPVEPIASTDFASSRPLVSLGDALNQFNPPEGFNLGGAELAERKVRYGFRAAGFSFLIREGVGSEVLPMMPFATIPNTPSWLVGLLNLHGNLVPICDFMRVSGDFSKASGSADSMILVLGKGDSVAGFLIDGYPSAVVNPQQTNHIAGIPEWLASSVISTFIANHEVWLEFDYENFLKKAT